MKNIFKRRVIVDTLDDALKIRDTAKEIAYSYGYITVTDLNDLAGIPTTYIDNHYGWTSKDISEIKIEIDKNAYGNIMFAVEFPVVKKIIVSNKYPYDIKFENIDGECLDSKVDEYCDNDVIATEAVFNHLKTDMSENNKTADMVNNPPHYQSETGLEVIDVIEAFTFDLKGIEATDTGNAIKYICRWKNKNGVQDLKKAQWYINHLIKHVELLESENNKKEND